MSVSGEEERMRERRWRGDEGGEINNIKRMYLFVHISFHVIIHSLTAN